MGESKKPRKRFLNDFHFEEIDHRLSCGWYVELENKGQKKRFLPEAVPLINKLFS